MRSSCKLISLLVILFVEAVGSAAGSFSIEQVMSAPFASELVAAPSGAHVAWVENVQGRRNIWLASGPEWKAVQATNFQQDDGQEIADLTWAPDATYLLFSRGGDFENGGENPNPGLETKRPDQSIWRLGLKGGAPIKLGEGRAPSISPQNKIVFLRKSQIFEWHDTATPQASELVSDKGRQSDIKWSPDGNSFAFVSERGDHSFIALYDYATKQLRYLDASVDQDGAPVWSPDGKQLAFVRIPAASRPAFFSARREGQPWSMRVVDVNSGRGHEVFRASEGPGSLFHELASETQLYWSATNHIVFPWERTGWLHLYSVAATGGEPVELTPGEGEVEHVSASHDGSTIYFSTNIGDIDRRHIASVSAGAGGKSQALTRGENIEWQPVAAADGSAITYLNSSFNRKAHVSVLVQSGAAQGGQVAELSPAPPPDFPAKQLVTPQPVMITAADGLTVHGQLFLPPNTGGHERRPALIFFHGGSRRQMLLGFHYMYYYSNAYSLNQFLANQGYVVLSINYRSGIGYGLNFREAVNYGARGGSEFNDVIGAGLYLKSRPDVDGKRIGVWGGSYGGYLTAMALARASDLFAAGVDFHGVHDWSSLRGYLTSGAVSGDPDEVKQRQEAARIAFESSPMASVNTWRSPVLLIHGDDDRNVEFSQTVMLVEALRKRHVDMEELIFPDEIHDFLLHRHWMEAYQATADFFARKLARSGQDGRLKPNGS